MNKLKQYLNILFGIPLCLLGAALLCLILFSEDKTSSLIVITIAAICLIPGIYLLANTKYFSQLSKQAKQHKQEADEYYQQKKAEADQYYQNRAGAASLRLENEQGDLDILERKKQELLNEIELLENTTLVGYSQIYIDENYTSEQYKNELAMLKLTETELIKSNAAVQVFLEQTRKSANDNTKQILRCFNAETQIIINSVTSSNIDRMRGKITKSYEILNKIFAVDGVCLTPSILENKLAQLICTYSYQLKKEAEKEEQKLIRQQMLEEEKVRREIEFEKNKLEKEEKQFKNEINKLMKYLQKANDIEKQLYIDKIHELEDKLALLEADREQVLQREQNTRAGFVYVISNIGSFGEGIYKIGMTRRLEPMDRIKELGSASVPFEFDVHAMIFSEDAPALENILHKTFRKYEVNKVNQRKEFFRIPLSEIEKVVTENHNATVIFTEIAKAEQYRESLRIAEAESDNNIEPNQDNIVEDTPIYYDTENYIHTKWGIYEKPVPYTIKIEYGARQDVKRVF